MDSWTEVWEAGWDAARFILAGLLALLLICAALAVIYALVLTACLIVSAVDDKLRKLRVPKMKGRL